MFSSEIKETIYIAIGCILAAAVLGLVAFVLDARSDLASAQNDLVATRTDMESYREFNRYQNAILYGEDVIEVIRRFANTDIAVYVKDYTGSNIAQEKPGLEDEAGNVYPFYMDKKAYIDDPGAYSMSVLDLGTHPDTGATLYSDGIKRNTTYFSYLVYGMYNEEDIKKTPYTEDANDVRYSEVTGIVITRVGEGRHNYAVNQAACGCSETSCSASDIYDRVNVIRSTR